MKSFRINIAIDAFKPIQASKLQLRARLGVCSNFYFYPSTHRSGIMRIPGCVVKSFEYKKNPSMWKRLKIKFYCFRLQSNSHLLYAFPSCAVLTLGLSVLAKHPASFPWTIKILRMMFASLLWQFSSWNRFNQNFIELLSSYLYARVRSALKRLFFDKM